MYIIVYKRFVKHLHNCNRFVQYMTATISPNVCLVECFAQYVSFPFTTKETMVVRELQWWYAIRGKRNRSSIFKL